MVALISIDNLYTGKYLATLNQRDDLVEAQKGVKFIGQNTISSFGLPNQLTGELMYDENAGKKAYDYLVTERFAKKMGWI